MKLIKFWFVGAIAKSWRWDCGIIKKATKSLIAIVLILSLSSCGGKAVSQEPFTSGKVRDNPQLTNQISEVSPPSVIQELRRSLEKNQPQVKIVSPKSDEVLENDTVDVRFQVKDLPIFQDSQYKLGPHLHVILDNQPYIAVYDINQPLTLSNLSAGTHTLRVFASRPWHESFKNEGAYAQTTFHVFTKTDENNPNISQPLLTYSRPKGEYGAEPILLDFYLTNAPLQIAGKDILKDDIGDWRIRCTINGESFVLDRWESVYLKGFKPGKNWVKIEFLDGQGKVVKNVFNTTVRSIDYEPKGKDTLSKIIRGELSTEQVRSIIDPNYSVTIPIVEPTVTATPTPTIEPKIEPKLEIAPKTQITEEKPTDTEVNIPEIQVPVVIPKVELKQPEKAKSGELSQPEVLKSPTAKPSVKATPEPTASETLKAPELVPEIIDKTSIPEIPKAPQKTSNFGKYFQHSPANLPVEKPVITPITTPSASPALQSPLPNNQPSISPETPNVIDTPSIKATPTPTEPAKSRFSKYLQNPQVTPTPVTKPVETKPVEAKPVEAQTIETQVEPKPEVIPVEKTNTLQQKVTNQLEKIKSSKFLQRLQIPKPESSANVETKETEVSEENQ
ncbi:hypothetical protein [Calothrix sp. UHCC 0171]|uniref:hypothetical protein n=1 Tax=Calothrix sp. UHCC 0171 TaxID=3110245 RepID=UPI002B1FE3AF|nr:hypothetical protein [Calothrix sp. UHCC 0171]MEA5569607.1 hypothetical protein [Calothrix sp. UHCC 0171]